MFTQNELDFNDYPICEKFPAFARINGWDSVIDGGHALTGKFVSLTEFWARRQHDFHY